MDGTNGTVFSPAYFHSQLSVSQADFHLVLRDRKKILHSRVKTCIHKVKPFYPSAGLSKYQCLNRPKVAGLNKCRLGCE